MIYGKLAVILLNSIASENAGSTNSIIAEWLLANQEQMKNMTIRDVAEGAHVGIASVSRFVRELGFEDFKELKELLIRGLDPFEVLETDSRQLPDAYLGGIRKGMQKVHDTLDYEACTKCVRAIAHYNNIWIFSLLKGQSAAISLAADLSMLGKKARTIFSYREQMEILKNSTKDDLVILFSLTGSYFAYEERVPKREEINAPVIMITGGENRYPELTDLTISFASSQHQIDHPYTLLYVAGILAQMYAQTK